MAPLTCTTSGCGSEGSELAVNELTCQVCGSPGTSASYPSGRDKSFSAGGSSNRESDSDLLPESCDERARVPGDVSCPPGGAAASGPLQDYALAGRRFGLTTPLGSDWMVESSRVEIGRETGPLASQLQAYLTVSRRHAALCITSSGQLQVIDLGSTNGTFHNGRRITPNVAVNLCHGDSVWFSNALKCTVYEEGCGR